MKIRSVLVDDEQPARDELRYLLSQHDDIEIIGEAESASKAVATIMASTPDLVFLDIQMPGKDGFAVISELAVQMETMPLIVFATAYDNYAVKAFEKSAIDYIMKPFSEKRLATTLQRVRKRLQRRDGKREERDMRSVLRDLLLEIGSGKNKAKRETLRISVEKGGRMLLLSPDEIVYCSYESSRILVHTESETLPIYGIPTLDKLADHLAGSSFFRAHRALLVNLNHVREFSPWFNGKYHLIMDDKSSTELSVSRSRVKEFKHRLGLAS